MALTTTTLGAAVAVGDLQIKVASASGFLKGYYIRIDNELLIQSGDVDGLFIPVRRGQLGTSVVAHANSSNVNVGLGSDMPDETTQLAEPTPFSNQASRPYYAYSASGAITPAKGLHQLIGTGTLVMTLAVPSKLQDGDELTIIGNGKSVSTVTFATAIGNAGAGYTVLTFPAGGQVGYTVIACNGVWVPKVSPLSGTATNITIALS